MNPTLTQQDTLTLKAKLQHANRVFRAANPGPFLGRQAVHTVYGGAHLFKADTARKMGASALKALESFAPDAKTLQTALRAEGDSELWSTIHRRVIEKLRNEAIEDFRIDFEDGYGNRPHAEEDGQAEQAAREVAEGFKAGTLPPFIGIRVKPFNEENLDRSLKTLDLFLTTLAREAGDALPRLLSGFVVTLPKITHLEQSSAMAEALSLLEHKLHMPSRSLRFELMIETPQAILDDMGHSPIRGFIEASKGRCVAAHFGTYDYTAGCDISAEHQTMINPVCDFAKHVMQVSLAGTPIQLSDGATNIMPVGDRDSVHRAWALSYRHIQHSLATGFYQGWDLHPNQLPVRYAAIYAFFLQSFDASASRLSAFIEKAAKATLLGDVFDDAATGQGLLNYFLRALSCGAIDESQLARSGLTLEEIRSRSFLKVLEGRKKL